MVMFDRLLRICKLGMIVQWIHKSIKQRDLYENASRYLLHILFNVLLGCIFIISIPLFCRGGGAYMYKNDQVQKTPIQIYLKLSRNHHPPNIELAKYNMLTVVWKSKWLIQYASLLSMVLFGHQQYPALSLRVLA